MTDELKIPNEPALAPTSSGTNWTGDLRASSYIVLPKGESLFSEYAITVSVDDEAGGAFIVLSSCAEGEYQKVKIDFAEWSLICDAVERLRREWVGESKAMTNQPEELMHESNNHPV